VLEMGEVQAAARKFGMEVAKLEIRRARIVCPRSSSRIRTAESVRPEKR
jgi:hypothetical protein